MWATPAAGLGCDGVPGGLLGCCLDEDWLLRFFATFCSWGAVKTALASLRLVVAIYYAFKVVLIKWLGTHKEYDKNRCKAGDV